MGQTVVLVVLLSMLQGFLVLYSHKFAFEHACVCLLVKVGVCESHCVQLWSRWGPPAPSVCLIFLLPPSFIRSPRHTNNLQLGQSWLAPCLYTHTNQSHSKMLNSTSPQHQRLFKIKMVKDGGFFFLPLLLSWVDTMCQSDFYHIADHRKIKPQNFL